MWKDDDKDIWDKDIYAKENKLTDFLKKKSGKLALFLALWWIGAWAYYGFKNTSENKLQDGPKNTIEEIFENQDVEDFTHETWIEKIFENQVLEDFTNGTWADLQEKREKRYRWSSDNVWDNTCNWPAHRKLVLDWFSCMINNGDLDMIIKKVDAFNQLNGCKIPYDIVFLALAESWRKWDSQSSVAGWFWQFTKSTAKLFWLSVKGRFDKEKSTDAALRHFYNNIKIVERRMKKSKKKLSKSDQWKYAFWMYNWSPKLVGKWYKAGRWHKDDWIVNNYFEYNSNNSETKNYVPRILAIRHVLKDDFEHGKIICQSPPVTEITKQKKSKADLSFEKYLALTDEKITPHQKQVLLNHILSEYKQSLANKEITQEYYTSAEEAIQKEKESIKDVNEEMETWIFVNNGLDKDKSHEVYSYIIKKWWNIWWVVNQFKKQFPGQNYIWLQVVDEFWKSYDGKTKFKANQTIFLKKPLKSFEYIRNSNDDKYHIYSYTIKNWGGVWAVINQFIKQFPTQNKGLLQVTDANWNKYDNKTHFYPGLKVYIKQPIK